MPISIIPCDPTKKPDMNCMETCNFGLPIKGTSGRNGQVPLGIVIHCLNESLESYRVHACLDVKLSQNSKPNHTSLHYVVGAQGFIDQWVAPEDTAWGFSNLVGQNPPNLTGLVWPLITSHPGIQPDLYTIHIGVESGAYVLDTWNNCIKCQGSPIPLEKQGQDKLAQLLSWLHTEFNIPLDADHVQFHQNIDASAEDECGECRDIDEVLCCAIEYCEPMANPADPTYETQEPLTFVYGHTERGRKAKMTLSAFKALLAATP